MNIDNNKAFQYGDDDDFYKNKSSEYLNTVIQTLMIINDFIDENRLSPDLINDIWSNNKYVIDHALFELENRGEL